ncbi:csbD-like family protein [Rhodotorula toruloides]|uniref:CsbD-like family protein n=1 Tax=Rhodotorula toruloides TaxID=5286 RepID=A0A511KRG1_RHOTO|nr:csbD-like family protein [Rhodotorula toruloides]
MQPREDAPAPAAYAEPAYTTSQDVPACTLPSRSTTAGGSQQQTSDPAESLSKQAGQPASGYPQSGSIAASQDITAPSASQQIQETPAAEGQAGTQSRSQTLESAEQHPSQPAGSQPVIGTQRDESKHTTGGVAKHPATVASHPAHPGIAAEEKEGEKRAGEKTTSTATGGAPSVGDKIVGATQKAVRKVTDDPSQVAEGQARKAEGKAAAADVREARAA